MTSSVVPIHMCFAESDLRPLCASSKCTSQELQKRKKQGNNEVETYADMPKMNMDWFEMLVTLCVKLRE